VGERRDILAFGTSPKEAVLREYAPPDIERLHESQTAIPKLAKDEVAVRDIEAVLPTLPTRHQMRRADSRELDFLPAESVQLVLTSPPYWTLKQYNEGEGQLGNLGNYDRFLEELDRVWAHCFRALVHGGRLICVVGDVCLSRRKNNGRHTVVPLHASIQERCRAMGFDNLAPIIWHKIANAALEVPGNGGGFLGKPYEPNAVIKNDIEFVLMERKPGGYRSPSFKYGPTYRGLRRETIPRPSRSSWQFALSECSASSAIPSWTRSWVRAQRPWPRGRQAGTA